MDEETSVAAAPKVAVTISRHWHEPKIHTVISGEGIAMAILLDDYVLALEEELNRLLNDPLPNLLMRQAARTVLEKIKEESAKVV